MPAPLSPLSHLLSTRRSSFCRSLDSGEGRPSNFAQFDIIYQIQPLTTSQLILTRGSNLARILASDNSNSSNTSINYNRSDSFNLTSASSFVAAKLVRLASASTPTFVHTHLVQSHLTVYSSTLTTFYVRAILK